MNETKKAIIKNPLVWAAVVLFAGIAYIVVANPGGVLTSVKGNFAGSDAVVAILNGEEITETDLEVRIAQVRSDLENRGQFVPEEISEEFKLQVVNILINEQLVLKAAEEAGALPGEKLVDQQLSIIRSRFDSEEAFLAELSSNQFTLDNFRENIRRQLSGQLLVAALVPAESLNSTDEEVQSHYDTLVAGQEEPPPFDLVRDQVENDLRQNKTASFLGSIITRLRQDAEISILLAASAGSGENEAE